jgi:hypothetical protein
MTRALLPLALTVLLLGCNGSQLPSITPGHALASFVAVPKQPGAPDAIEGRITQLLGPADPRKPQLLGVVKLEPPGSGEALNVVAIESEELSSWGKAVTASGKAGAVRALPAIPLDHQQNALDSLRLTAARMQCDLLLIYAGFGARASHFNNAAALYWTLIGLWLAPGDTLEEKAVMQAVLIDCRTGAIIGTATGDAHMREYSPAAYSEIARARLAKKVPPKALASLQANCQGLFQALPGPTSQSPAAASAPALSP